jgi:hypothetical protein
MEIKDLKDFCLSTWFFCLVLSLKSAVAFPQDCVTNVTLISVAEHENCCKVTMLCNVALKHNRAFCT